MVPRAVVVLVLVLVLSGRAAAEPIPARTAVPLPVPAAKLAQTLSLPSANRSEILLHTIRIVFDPPDAPGTVGDTARLRLAGLFAGPRGSFETVPLPLTPKIWRETIFDVPVQEKDVIAGICANRSAGLMYYGLSALDDETLQWLGQHRDVLVHLTKHPGVFAAFGRSLRIAAGRVVVPGGAAAEPLWREIVGSDPAQPASFVRNLVSGADGRLAFFYDTIAHVDAPKQRLALASRGDIAGRPRALLGIFESFARDWYVDLRPFTRPQLDPVLLLEASVVTPDGALVGPVTEGIWNRVFQDDTNIELHFREVAPWKSDSQNYPVDIAWLASRIHLVPYPVGRRRLETFFYAQRVLANTKAEPHVIASVLRAAAAMPALMLTLERIGERDADALLRAVRHAHALTGIGNATARTTALSVFQASLGFIERGRFTRAVTETEARRLVASLTALRPDAAGYEDRVAEWLRTALFKAAPQPPIEATDPIEMALLALVSGARDERTTPVVEWEGNRYRVDPAGAELKRMQRVREQQETPTVDAAIAQLQSTPGSSDGRQRAAREFATILVSILYAAHIGDPEGPALAAGNVALRHDLGGQGIRPGSPAVTAWRLPNEIFARAIGWHVQGSLLGLDVALRRLALRRLDLANLPAGPKLALIERQTAMLTVALTNAHSLADDDRDRIASAMARGRARVQALAKEPALLDRVAEDAGLSAWRKEALRWTLAHASDDAIAAMIPLELLWLGNTDSALRLDEWGAATLTLDGCLCLKMPRRAPWENLMGRPSAGLLATRGVDAMLRVAEVLAELKLPAALAAAVLGYAMQDALDETQPAHFEDWQAYGRAAKRLSTERIVDYIAALTAGGPLLPVTHSSAQQH